MDRRPTVKLVVAWLAAMLLPRCLVGQTPAPAEADSVLGTLV